MKIIVAFLLLIPAPAPAQLQERQLLGYNIAFGAVTSGIGAVINKPKHTSWKKYFIRGAWQGSIGGLLNYSGKKTLHLIQQHKEPGFAWPARILHHAGTSIMENAALNEPFLQNWNMDIGPVRIDFSTKRKPVRVRLQPSSIYATIKGMQYGRFDWGLSLQTGTLAFYSKDISSFNGYGYEGASFQRAFVYSDFFEDREHSVIAHEMVHIFQYSDYIVLNAWAKPLEKKVTSPFFRKVFSKYVYADIPYFNLFYLLEGKHHPSNHYKNFYEFEAERMATNRHVNR